MAAKMGLSPDIMETEGFLPDKGENGGGTGASLMERLRGRSGQHRSWTDTIKAVRLAQMNDKRLQSVTMEMSSLQKCLATLHRAMKITNHQSLIERLNLISRQLGMSFTPPTTSDSQVTLSTDMFKVVVMLEGQSGIKDVQVGHQGIPNSCEELRDVLRKGKFDEFVEHLQGLLSMYSIPGDKTVRRKGYLALDSLETDLNLLAQLQSSINGVANYIHKSPLGILLPRRGGHPMKLIYYVSPYDLLCKKTNSSHPMTLEAITEHDLGHSVTVCLEASVNNNKLQTMPLNSVKSNQDGKNLPSFQGVNNINSCSLSASFVLVLPQPVPVSMSVIQAIQDITGLDAIYEEEKSFLQVLLHSCSDGSIGNKKELFVTLPDQQHVYYLNCACEGVLAGTGCLLRKIPFTHPTSVPNVLNLLRQQLVFNSVLRSIVRPQAKQEYVSSVMYEITAVSLQYISVLFEHPLHNSMITVEFNLSDITNVKCNMCTNDGQQGGVCTDDFVSKTFQRCFSIPVTLRSVIMRVQEEIRQLVPPEPVEIPVNKLRWTWTRPKPVVKMQPLPMPISTAVPTSLTNTVSVSPTPVTSLNFPNPPPYPGSDSWSHSPSTQQIEMHKYSVGFGRPYAEPKQASLTPPMPMQIPVPAELLSTQEPRPPANPLLATLLDAGSPAVVETVQSVVNESPMLSKLLEENTSVATNPFPAPNVRKRINKRKSSKDMLAGKSPKHRLSDSDMAERTSERVNCERHGQGMGEKHIDLDSSGGLYDEPMRPSSVSSVSSIGGQSTGSIIDLTDIGESHVKKLENSLDSIMGKESPHGSSGIMGLGNPMNSQLANLDHLDINLNFPDLHPNQNVNSPLLGDPGGDFQPPLQWGSRQTPPTPTSRNSPHHGVVPKNEKTSTSLEELLQQGPRGRENEGPNSVHMRRNSQTAQSQQQRRANFKRQNSTGGRNSIDSMSGGISPSFDVFSPLIPSPIHHTMASPTQLTMSSPNYSISPSSSLTLMSPSHYSTAISPNLQQQPHVKLECLNIDSKSGILGSHVNPSTANITASRMNSTVGHITSGGKPSLSMLKAQLEMTNKCSYSAISQEKDCSSVKDELSSSSTANSAGAQPPLVKLKLTNMRPLDSVSTSDSEDSKTRSSTFDFHSDDDEEFGLPMEDKMTIVSASPTRLQISNKSTLASFNKFNKSEKFKRKQREKELKCTLSVDSGKRKRDREDNRKDKKKKKLNSYSVDKEIAVYKSTTVEGGNENDHYKPMPKLKINLKKKGVKMSIENSVLQVKEVKSVDKNEKLVQVKDIKQEDKIVDKLEKEAIVKIEKVERSSKKSDKIVNSVKEGSKSEKRKEKSTDKPCAPISRTPSASDEGIFDKINAMKTENLGKNEDSNSSVDRKSNQDSASSSSSHKKLTSSKSVKSHKRSNSKSDSKISRNPTIRLKPITLPTNSSSSVNLTRTPSTPSTPITPKSVTQSPTSTTIGKIGAVSLATSGSQKQITNSNSTKSPQGSSSSAKSVSSRSLSSGGSGSSKMGSNLQKSIQIQGPSGKNSPVPQNSKSGHSRSTSTSALNSSSGSLKSDKSLNKSLNSSTMRTSSPSLEKEKSKSSSSSSRSSSSSGRDREKSTSSSKTSVPVTTVITQETAASVLSFLNPKANKIASFTIPKLSSNSSGQKVSTPTGINSPTIVSTCASTTSVTTTTTNSSVKFSNKGSNSMNTTVSSSKGSNSSNANSSSGKNTINTVSNSANVKNSNSYNKNSNNFQSGSSNRPQNLSVSNTANASRSGNNSPNNYPQKNNSAYNKPNNSQNASANQNSGFRNYNNSNSSHSKPANWNNSGNSYNKTNHSTNHANQNQNSGNRGNNSTYSGNSKSGNSSSNNSDNSTSNRQSNAGNHVNNTNSRTASSGQNAPKGPGPPNNQVDSGSKTKATGGSSSTQAAGRGRKGSLSAVIDKLTCKASGPSIVLPVSNATGASKTSSVSQKSEVIVNESPASPEMDVPMMDTKDDEKKVVIFEAPASPEPEAQTPASPAGSKPPSSSKIVSIPLENKPSQSANDKDFYKGRTKTDVLAATNQSPKDHMSQKLVKLTSPKTIPLHSSPHGNKQSQPKSSTPDVNCKTKQNNLQVLNCVSQQNGDVANENYNDNLSEDISNHFDLSNNSKAKDTAFKVPTPKRQESVDGKSSDNPDSVDVRRTSRSDSNALMDTSSPPSSPENGLIIDFSPSALNHQNKTNSPQCNNSSCENTPDNSLRRSSPNFMKLSSIKSTAKVRASPSDSPSGRDNSSTGSNPNSPAYADDYLDLMDEALGLGN